MKIKYLHLFASDTNEKFSSSFIEFIKHNFVDDEHMFLLVSGKNRSLVSEAKNTKNLPYGVRGTIALLKEARGCEKVFFHGLPENKYITLGLLLSPGILRKGYWLIWGGDLYDHNSNRKSSALKTFIKRQLKRFAVSRFKGLITYIDGTYDLAVELYGAKGGYFRCIMYPTNTWKDMSLTHNAEKNNGLNILVGNSALPRNNHFYLFDKIKRELKGEYKVICPLSYGDFDHRDKVIKRGKEILGNSFHPVTGFMKYDEYVSLLSGVDIAVYGHEKNQAMGNIITLLGLGKKVYIRNDITSWETLRHLGIKVYATNEEVINADFPTGLREKNVEIVKNKFSHQTLVSQWEKIFNSG